MTSLPPAGQEPLERDLLDLRADFLDRAAQVEASGMALRRRTALYDALDGYVAGVTRDPGQIDRAAGRMDSLIAGLGLPEARQGAMRLFVKDVLGNAAVDGLMQDPVRAERVLSDGLYDDMLSASSKVLRLKAAQDKVVRDQHLGRERTIADLVAQAHDGAASDEAIRQAQRQHGLSAADTAYLIEKNARAIEAARTRDARIRRVATATGRLDPSNPEDRAAGSDYWDSVSESYASDDPTAQQEAEFRFVERTGVLPRALERKYRGALLSMDPAVAVHGAGAIAHLAALDRALVQSIPAEEIRRAQAIDGYTSLGVASDRAVELGDEKVAVESARLAGPTRPGEIQVAANDEPPVMSDATAAGGLDEGIAEQENDGAGIQPDGSVVIIDPQTGERSTVDRENVVRVEKLADDQKALTAIRERFLEIYDAVASKEMTREEAAAALHAILETPDGPTISDPALREELGRLASDLPYAADREAAANVFTQRLLSPERREEIGREVLSLLPLVGEGISAVEAYEAFSAALDAWRQGDTDEALRQAGEGGLASLGALPIAGRLVHLTRGGVKFYRVLRGVFRRRSQKEESEKAPDEGAIPGPTEPLLPRPKPEQPEKSEDEGVGGPQAEAGPLSPQTQDEGQEKGPSWPNRPDWLSLDRERLRHEIEDEKGQKKWNTVTEGTGQMFNTQFVERYWERNNGNPNARPPHPPYDETVPSYTGRVAAGGRMFVRVFPKDGNGPGRWLMAPELFGNIRALPDATKILKDVLALEREPEFFTVVTIPEGTEIQFGGVNEHPIWGRGGVMQFEITEDVHEQWFSKPERIK